MWRDRLRAALAMPVEARHPSAVSADCVFCSPGTGADEQTAETAQTALGCLSLTGPDNSTRLAEFRAVCDARAADLAGAFDDAEVLADRAAIAAEPLLADPGSPERERLDREQQAMLAGLRLGFERYQRAKP